MDIRYQYSWKFVGTFKAGNKKTLLKSGRWFVNREDCVSNAENNRYKVSIYDAAIELKIVQRPLYAPSIDEVEDGQRLRSIENSLKLLFAEEVYHTTKDCSPSEIRGAVDSVNVDSVINRWLAYLDAFDLNQGLHPIYTLKFQCKDWLVKEYKGEAWKEEIVGIIAGQK